MPLRLLPQHIINRIAAGEVVERPGSAVKEITENALDAGATKIDVTISRSGRNLIRVQDDGKGMTMEELELCLLRHATSKLDDDDLWNIRSMGFRGEALASIASISRITIRSRKRGASESWEISCEGGGEQSLRPSSCPEGTCVEIKDLFFATPARLKFLKADRTEQSHIEEQLFRLGLAYPSVAFTLTNEKKRLFSLDVSGTSETDRRFYRVCAVTDPAFKENSLCVEEEDNDGYHLKGYAGLPTFHRSGAHHLYLFVNNRPVRDKSLITAVRVAYQDYLPRMRYPVAALFLELPVADVDVNVHPAKSEVRFKHDDKIRSLLIGGLRRALTKGAFRASTTIAKSALSKATPSAPNVFVQPSFNTVRTPSLYSQENPSGFITRPEICTTNLPHRPSYSHEIDEKPYQNIKETVYSSDIKPSYTNVKESEGPHSIGDFPATESLTPSSGSLNSPAPTFTGRSASLAPNTTNFTPSSGVTSVNSSASAPLSASLEAHVTSTPIARTQPPHGVTHPIQNDTPLIEETDTDDASFQESSDETDTDNASFQESSDISKDFFQLAQVAKNSLKDPNEDHQALNHEQSKNNNTSKHLDKYPSQGTPLSSIRSSETHPISEAFQIKADLGKAKCSLFSNYIIAQSNDALIIVDQHAAHERLRYERLKKEYREGGALCQPLLTPEIIDLSPEDFNLIEPLCPVFASAGLRVAPFGLNAVIVRGTPAILGRCDSKTLVIGLIDDLRAYGIPLHLQECTDEILSSIACRGAIKSGDRLHPEEMDALLRTMEETPYSGQCNHGRPTYVKLYLKDIERLFGRT